MKILILFLGLCSSKVHAAVPVGQGFVPFECKPARIESSPANAFVKVVSLEDAFEVQVTRETGASKQRRDYWTLRKAGHLNGRPAQIYTGEGLQLIVVESTAPRAAVLKSSHPDQDLNCN